jgi:hypothetical protein
VTDRIGLDRCWEELAAARLLADEGFKAQAVSRTYFAASDAAIRDAVRVVGEVELWLDGRSP